MRRTEFILWVATLPTRSTAASPCVPFPARVFNGSGGLPNVIRFQWRRLGFAPTANVQSVMNALCIGTGNNLRKCRRASTRRGILKRKGYFGIVSVFSSLLLTLCSPPLQRLHRDDLISPTGAHWHINEDLRNHRLYKVMPLRSLRGNRAH